MTHRRRIVDRQRRLADRGQRRRCDQARQGRQGGAKKVALVDDAAPDVVTYGLREDVVRFAEGVAERRELDVEWVKKALAQARFIPVVTRYIMPPTTGTAKNWAAYRARFVEPIRIRAGVAFWRANERWLGQAEDLYGVPPEIVVGIVGVETIFGRQMGDFRLIDALATLAFDFPSGRKDRSAFFKDELESLVRPLQERRRRSARLARQLRRRARHAAVHAVELQQVRGRLRRRRPRRPARQPRRRDRQRRQLPRRVRLEARHAGALRRQAADRHERARRPARARHRADLQRRRDGRSAAPGCPSRRSPSTACSPSSSCRTATRRRPTSPARPTSTR